MKSALIAPAAARVLDPRALGEAEVAALRHHAAAQLGRRRRGSRRCERSCASSSVSVEALTTVPMPPFHSRSTGARRIARITSLGVQHLVLDAQRRARLLGQRRCAWRCAATRRRRPRSSRGRSRPTRSRPARTAACARRTRLGRVGVGVDEDVAVVVGGDEADLVAQQHPVAEHVAGHVADADDGELVDRGVEVELAEVALERLPRAARGDPERLVVVARRAAGGERVAEPEAVAPRRRGWRCPRTSRCPCRPRRPGRCRRRRARARPRGGRPRRRRGCR